MPRGVYDRSKAKNSKSKNVEEVVVLETDDQIRQKLDERFSILNDLTVGSTKGDIKALIVSGPPGLGKSYTVESVISQFDPTGSCSEIIKGYVRATGLLRALYRRRFSNNIIVFDDADNVFFEDVSLNLIKAATDSTDKRRISWMSEANFEDEDGDKIPRQFEFKGTIIFITNLNFQTMIDRGHKLAPHLAALESRAMYLDLAMSTRRDFFIRIKQVLENGMLTTAGYSADIELDVTNFIEKNLSSLREVSLRTVLKLAAMRKTNPSRFESMARVVCCRK